MYCSPSAAPSDRRQQGSALVCCKLEREDSGTRGIQLEKELSEEIRKVLLLFGREGSERIARLFESGRDCPVDHLESPCR